jgi:hypothetical protein
MHYFYQIVQIKISYDKYENIFDKWQFDYVFW